MSEFDHYLNSLSLPSPSAKMVERGEYFKPDFKSGFSAYWQAVCETYGVTRQGVIKPRSIRRVAVKQQPKIAVVRTF